MNDNSRGQGRSNALQARIMPIPLEDMQGHSNGAQAPLFDFKGVLRLMRRWLWLIAAMVAICLGVVVFLNSITPNIYTASSRILLDEQNVNPFGSDEIFGNLDLSSQVVESQLQVIRAPYLLSRVVDDLDLSQNEAFMASPTTPTQDRISEFLASISPPEEASEPPSEAELFQTAVERLRDNLSVSRNAQTLIIRIEFSSASPELAAQVVNAVAEAYINNRLNLRQETASRAADWFDERMAELNAQAIDVERRMEQLSGGGAEALESSQTANMLQSARQNLQNAMAERSRAQTDVLRLRTIIESDRGLRGVPPSLASEPLSTLMEEAAAARASLANELLQDPSDADAIETLTSRIESLESTGVYVLTNLLSDAEARAADAESAFSAAETTFETARADGGGNVTNAIEVELRRLEGEARIYQELHENYLGSYLRTVQQQSFPTTEATIIEYALEPEFPDGPGLSRLGLLAILIGVTLGAGSAFAIESSDGRIRNSDQLLRAARAPFLGILPSHDDPVPSQAKGGGQLRLPTIHVPARQRDIQHQVIALPENRVALTHEVPQMYAAITNPLSPFSETIRRVNVEADNMQALISDGEQRQPKIIGFISDRQSRGRSIAAVNYAEMLAVGGSQTLLIDLDWTGLFLTEKIAPSAHFGIAELGMTNSAIRSEQAFWYDERTSLYFLPNRSMDVDATLDPGAFDQARLKSLISTLAGKFDTVVIDLSPMASSSDPAAMSEIVSGFVAVADWGQTKTASLSAELRRAAIHPPKLLGTVLNGVSAKELEKYQVAA
jgi:succinoglycan biosynthesis transport protein ExoP